MQSNVDVLIEKTSQSLCQLYYVKYCLVLVSNKLTRQVSTRKLRLEKFRSQPAQLAALQKNETDVGRERERMEEK